MLEQRDEKQNEKIEYLINLMCAYVVENCDANAPLLNWPMRMQNRRHRSDIGDYKRL